MKPRILIVDDEQSMCDLLETDLRLRDFAPRCFTSASEAFEASCREEFRSRADRPEDAGHGWAWSSARGSWLTGLTCRSS